MEQQILESVVSFFSARLRDIKKSHENTLYKKTQEKPQGRRAVFINQISNFENADSQRGAIYARISEKQLQEFESRLLNNLKADSTREIKIAGRRLPSNLKDAISCFGDLNHFMENDILNGTIFPISMKCIMKPKVATCYFNDMQKYDKKYMFIAGYESEIKKEINHIVEQDKKSLIRNNNIQAEKESMLKAAEKFLASGKGPTPQWETWKGLSEFQVSYPKQFLTSTKDMEKDCMYL